MSCTPPKLLGKNILGSGFDLDICCTAGPGRTSAARKRA